MELRESGELEKLDKKWWHDKGQCSHLPRNVKPEKPLTNALELSDVVGVFYMLLSGIVLASVVVVFEILYDSAMRARKQTVRQQLPELVVGF